MKSIILSCLAFILGAGSTYFYLNNKCCDKVSMDKKSANLSNSQGKDSINLNTLSIKTDWPIAHLLSVQYRKNAGLCTDPSKCSSKEGIFELSPNSITDISSAIKKIQDSLTANRVTTMPSFYRFYMGVDTGGSTPKTKLIVVGLKSDNTEYDTYIEIIDGHLPCPTMCDVNGSKIFMGSGASQNCCK